MCFYIERIQMETDYIMQVVQGYNPQYTTYWQIFNFLGQIFDRNFFLMQFNLKEEDLSQESIHQKLDKQKLYEAVYSECLSLPSLNIQRQTSDQINFQLGFLRKKLSILVKKLQKVDYNSFLKCFPDDQFIEDKAVLNLKKYNFELGLFQIAIQLQNPQLAEACCDKIYEDSLKSSQENRQLDIYFQLLKIYLANKKENALTLLVKKHNRFQLLEVLKILPPKVKISQIQVFLKIVVSQQQLNAVESQILQSQVLQQLQSKKVSVNQLQKAQTQLTPCQVCKEMLKKNIVVFGNGKCVCEKCFKEKKIECDAVAGI
uniref:Vacuolar sorting protein 39 domain 2-containing protein n=1 Tax=Trepomonas sp. PC1 TaxID=1076344 RepID=A0A146KB42_9EUKA|eukprot:JAP92609.1 Vacuolar sorting protein 39 domain 2-containing protein [Trepomonas sp. PC1]